MHSHSRLHLYSDGGARGNPGPAAIAFIILTEDGKILKKHSKFLGTRTNNQAEYEALIAALESAVELTDQELLCHLDSEIVVKHINGEYQVKDPRLKALWRKVQELRQHFRTIRFINVPRTDVTVEEVDRMVNQALDRRKQL